VNFIGHGDKEVMAAMAAQGNTLEFVHSSQFLTPVAGEFARELLEFTGKPFAGGCVFFTCGGSEAVETALKLARQYQVESGRPERFRIISQRQSYHGATLGAVAVSGNPRRRDLYLKMLREPRPFEHVAIPYCYRCAYNCDDCASRYAAELESALAESHGEAAAFIFEPVSGATLGAAVPPDGYLQKLAALCAQNDVLLIADEVMTGFGRTGARFAVNHWNVVPDVLVLGKGIASGYAPLGAVIANRKVVDAIAHGSGTLVHGFTYNAHPIAVAAGRAVLRRICDGNLVEAADSGVPTSVAHRIAEQLATLRESPHVGDVRGIGLLWGIEFVADKQTRQPFPAELQMASRVAAAASARGVSVYPVQGCVDGYAGDHILIAPPVTIAESDVTWGLEQLREAIAHAGTS
jgi:adenosylmethionine-8-amino-7-oxononanoate aminotransferase